MYKCLILFLLCGAASLSARLNVVATNGIVADWAEQVGGKEVSVTTFAGPGMDPHHFEPSPRQLGALAKADVVIGFGEGLEPWLGDAMQASGSPAELLVLTDHAELMEFGAAFWQDMPLLYPKAESKPPCCKEDAIKANEVWAKMRKLMPASHQHNAHDHGHDHGEYDPHVWLDPQQALMMVLAINLTLAVLDPAHADYFDERRQAYLDQLIELDEWAEARLGEVTANRRILIGYHDNLRYFGRRYGFFTPASILGSVSTEAPDPSAKQFHELLKLIVQFSPPALFIDASANPRLAQQIQREAGVPTVATLYTDNITAASGPAPDYLTLMRVNVETITDALR